MTLRLPALAAALLLAAGVAAAQPAAPLPIPPRQTGDYPPPASLDNAGVSKWLHDYIRFPGWAVLAADAQAVAFGSPDGVAQRADGFLQANVRHEYYKARPDQREDHPLQPADPRVRLRRQAPAGHRHGHLRVEQPEGRSPTRPPTPTRPGPRRSRTRCTCACSNASAARRPTPTGCGSCPPSLEGGRAPRIGAAGEDPCAGGRVVTREARLLPS